jgi:FlaA1/EpsC-like NDP-sugar epimerase
VGRGIVRRGPSALVDCLAVFGLYVLAAGVRTGGRLDQPGPVETAALAFFAGVVQVGTNILFDIYWRDWSVAALEDLVALLKSSALAFGIVFLVDTLTEPHVIPYAALFGAAPLVLFVECALKLEPRWGDILRVAFGRGRSGETVAIVGAGRTGQLLARDLLQHGRTDYQVARFVDDDRRKWGTYVRGVRVEGGIDDLRDVIERFGISLVVIAMRAPSHDLVRRVVAACEDGDVRIRAVAGISIDPSDTRGLRPLRIEELLGRAPVDLNTLEARQFLEGKRVLITGAAGSIGSELARQVVGFGPATLVLLDSNESGLHDLRETLGRTAAQIVLGDIRDEERMLRLFNAERPEVVFHAAAYKHVPILESVPAQAIATNVLGTASVLSAATASGVQHFIFVSTDKAVTPTSLLGLTKRLGELLTIAHARSFERRYCVVRFGNVLGSIGSVVPIFERQIDSGGPVTVTHPDATRYFMTLGEAAGLVIEAGAVARQGDLLVLDMGTPVVIEELARKMIRLRGLRVPQDISIVYSGLRPGEKLHEDLFFPHEQISGSAHPRVNRVATSTSADIQMLRNAVTALGRLIRSGDDDAAIEILRAAVEPTQAPRLTVLERGVGE